MAKGIINFISQNTFISKLWQNIDRADFGTRSAVYASPLFTMKVTVHGQC
jgi:hypothetical protein